LGNEVSLIDSYLLFLILLFKSVISGRDATSDGREEIWEGSKGGYVEVEGVRAGDEVGVEEHDGMEGGGGNIKEKLRKKGVGINGKSLKREMGKQREKKHYFEVEVHCGEKKWKKKQDNKMLWIYIVSSLMDLLFPSINMHGFEVIFPFVMDDLRER